MSDADAGWPAAPPRAESESDEGWAYAPEPPSGVEQAPVEPVSSTWAASPAEDWPAPPGAHDAMSTEPPTMGAEAAEEPPSVEPEDWHSASASLERARSLVEELRETIAAIPEGSPADIDGVISDLEVAATHPAALPADDLAALREALFTARERPRDLDTLLDLTQRLDAMIALVIGYDRALAAIERSLDTLRGDRVLG